MIDIRSPGCRKYSHFLIIAMAGAGNRPSWSQHETVLTKLEAFYLKQAKR